MTPMSLQATGKILRATEHLPAGATLVIPQIAWEDYERVLDDLGERPCLRVSYDCGRLEIMSPLPEHEEYGRFIEGLVRILSEELDLKVQSYGSATWKRQRLAKGAEPSETVRSILRKKEIMK